MFISGCSNSLLTKYQDNQCIGNCSGPSEDKKYFEQPVFQTVQMFVAECLCWVIYAASKSGSSKLRSSYEQVPSEAPAEVAISTPSEAVIPNGTGDDESTLKGDNRMILKGANVLLLALPAFCDVCGTTLMNSGLLLVPVSIYQMSRGSVVLFVGLFSMIFLKHSVNKVQWTGLFCVFVGVFVVGLSAALGESGESEQVIPRTPIQVIAGMLIILFGQLFTATQFVVEEYILEKYLLAPVKVVAWEGTFGGLITIVGSTIIAGLFMKPESVFDLRIGTEQVLSSKPLIVASLLIMLSMATFNYTGLTVTRFISATSRSTIDTSRTVGIWVVSMILGWEKFQFLQLLGFGILVYGTLLFNGLIGKQPPNDPLPNEFEHT